MKIPQHSSISARGGLLVVALMMTMVAGIFLAGWVSLSAARSTQALTSGYAAKRRVMNENSRIFIRQMCMEQAFSGYSSIPGATVGDITTSNGTGTDGWGGLYTGTGWSGLELYGQAPSKVAFPLAGYYTTYFPFNSLGLRPGACFTNVQVLTRPAAYDGAHSYQSLDGFNGYAFMKGIFPAFAGDAMVIYHKPDDAPGEINLSNFQVGDNAANRPGRFVIRDPASFYDSATLDHTVKKVLNVRTKNYYVQKFDPLNPVYAKTLTGTEYMPSNLPAASSTFGQEDLSATPRQWLTRSRQHQATVPRRPEHRGQQLRPPGLPATVTRHPNCLYEIQNREAIKDTDPVPVQTISVGTSTGISTDPYWIADESGGSGPTYRPPGYPAGYDTGFQVLFINLNHPNLPNLRIYPVVQQVVFYGQSTNAEYSAAATMSPRIFLFLPDPGGAPMMFKDVRFARENSRPFVLGVKAQVTGQPLELFWMPPSVATGTPLTLDWRMILINEGRQISCYRPSGAGGTPDSVILTGGIFTNWSVQRNQLGAGGGAADTGSASKFILLPEVMPVPATASSYYLSSLLPREAWIENFFQISTP